MPTSSVRVGLALGTTAPSGYAVDVPGLLMDWVYAPLQPAPRPRHERGRDRQEQAGAVTGAAVRGDSATVTDVREPLQRRVQDLPRRAALCVGDEADATCVALDALLLAEVVHGRPLPGWKYERKNRLEDRPSRRGGERSAG